MSDAKTRTYWGSKPLKPGWSTGELPMIIAQQSRRVQRVMPVEYIELSLKIMKDSDQVFSVEKAPTIEDEFFSRNG